MNRSCFALVDCNNFYVSCERLFNPKINNNPVVVLSNNDGCVISRSEEAKSLGISMGVPVFEISEIIKNNYVHVFSSNYPLYGDISQRVMKALESLSLDIEIYSIDEAFLDISSVNDNDLFEFGTKIRKTIMLWTGIPVSVGIGASKTLAKLANHYAKKKESDGVFVFREDSAGIDILKSFSLEEVWGVGEKYAQILKRKGLASAFDLRTADAVSIGRMLNVTVRKTIMELRGISCYKLEINPGKRKVLCVSRSFGKPIKTIENVIEATADFTGRIGEKLRKKQLCAQSITLFLMTNRFSIGPHYVNSITIPLPVATNQTGELNHFAVKGIRQIFRKGYLYKKSGVIANDLVRDDGVQSALWDEKNRDKMALLMKEFDRINAISGTGTVHFALLGKSRRFKQKQEKLSARYTTRWNELLLINADKVAEANDN